MFQFRQLKTFVAAAETLSFTEAARRVHLSQPSVTEQIRALEHSVGEPLFVRTHNRLTLTTAGEKLAARARELLALADDTRRELRSPAGDRIAVFTVAAPPTLVRCLLAPALARWTEQHPAVRVEIQESNSAATVRAVIDRKADLGLIHGWPANDAAVHVEVIARDTPMVVMPPGHPLGAATTVRADALADHPLYVTVEGCRYRAYLDALLQEAAVRPTMCGVADSAGPLLQMVAAGLGVAVLPRRAIDTAAAHVEMRPLATTGDGLPICLLTPGRRPTTGPVAAFAERLRLAARGSNEPMPAFDMQHGAGRIAVA